MCMIGPRALDKSTLAQNQFTVTVARHQHEEGLGVSIENPKGSLLFEQDEIKELAGTLTRPKAGWSFYRSEGCQLGVTYPGSDTDHGKPIWNPTC